MNEKLERFLRYIKIDTQSDDNSTSTPSAKKEYDLLNLLRKELLELGIEGEITKEGRLYAYLEGEQGL
ncbi:MAG: peptidase T, partial [Bacilli bacterium]|nr:peptidase T [Bacilli bacterium]